MKNPLKRTAQWPNDVGVLKAVVTRLAMLLLILCAMSLNCAAQEIKPGLYRIETRTLLPHLEEMRRAVTTANVCLASNKIERLFPILKQPGMVDCKISRTLASKSASNYSLVCPGKNGAEGTATVYVSNKTIDAELIAKLGGKNMTFSQFSDATLIGDCSQ